MKKEKSVINISISSKDETKSQTVYNNVISNMEKLSLTKDEQLEYLKMRVTDLENEQKNRWQSIVVGFFLTIIMIFGLFLIAEDFYTLGIIIALVAFFSTMFIMYKFSKNHKNDVNDKYEEIDTIRKLINSKLK